MERETDKHNPRIDEAMTHDVESLLHGAAEESRAQEGRLQEDPAVSPGRRFDEMIPGVEITDADVEGRSELSRHLASAQFRAGRDELVAAAQDAHAPADLVAALGDLPADEVYENVQAVWQALGGNVEAPHTQPE
jgi:hypothetical protein